MSVAPAKLADSSWAEPTEHKLVLESSLLGALERQSLLKSDVLVRLADSTWPELTDPKLDRDNSLGTIARQGACCATAWVQLPEKQSGAVADWDTNIGLVCGLRLVADASCNLGKDNCTERSGKAFAASGDKANGKGEGTAGDGGLSALTCGGDVCCFRTACGDCGP